MAKLDTVSARAKLKPKRRYWRTLTKGLALGYWRGANRSTWILRQLRGTKYELSVIGAADDLEHADGVTVFSFAQAQQKALASTGRSEGPLTVRQAVERYLEDIKARKGESAERDARSKLTHVLSSALADKRVADLKIEDYRKWQRGLVKKDPKDKDRDRRSKDTANRVLHSFKAAINHSARDPNGEWHQLKAFKGVARSRKDHFDVEQAQRLIDAARTFDPDLANLLTAGFLTGCRYGELAACNVEHFDDGVLDIPSGKTGERPVILTADAIAFFESISGRNGDEPLFKKADGERWGKSHQHRPIKRALKLAKLPASASFYSLRHSYVTQSIYADVPLSIIARNCGTSEKIIGKTYAKLIAEKEREYLERVSKSIKLRVIEGGRQAA